MKEFEEIYRQTGKWLGMIGHDYGLAHDTDIGGNNYLIDYWNQGGLVTISHHPLNPETRKLGSANSKKINFSALFDPRSETYRNWRKDLDHIARGLQELRDNGVVVLWPPLHEMNKNFFWWGDRNPRDFIAFWREMFDYFTCEKGLDNLLWVYSPYEADNVDQYYPGDDYVDIVALDSYKTDLRETKGYEALARIDKPFGIGEYGPSGGGILFFVKVDKDIDYSQLIKAIKERFSKTVFFQSWGGKWGIQSHRNSRQLLHDPWIINRGDLAWRETCSAELNRSSGGSGSSTELDYQPSYRFRR